MKKPIARFNWQRTSQLFATLLLALYAVATAAESDPLELSLEDLLNVEITSASKKQQSLSDTSSAIFVIRQEDIRRSGASSIPDLLRMVPGMTVGQITTNKWAVSSRGFNGSFANKLLVLIDGRSVYTNSFSGVYWDMQDLLFEDIERIEVIRGPGATVWGANAVNGVINIITSHSADTQNGIATLSGSDKGAYDAAIRWGGKLTEGVYGRTYVKALQRPDTDFANFRQYGANRSDLYPYSNSSANDEWDNILTGFRVDAQSSAQKNYTIQGEYYRGNIDQTLLLTDPQPANTLPIRDSGSIQGAHLNAKMQYIASATSTFSLQGYFDQYNRKELILDDNRKTFDLEFNHHLQPNERHDIVWGIGYRRVSSSFGSSNYILMVPKSQQQTLYSGFLQDEIPLFDKNLHLTVGVKLERQDGESSYQPNLRLFWDIATRQKSWVAVSQAIRTPSTGERTINMNGNILPPSPLSPLPVLVKTLGNPNMEAEKLTAYELGYRIIPDDSLSLDVALFYNDYNNLRTFNIDYASVRPVSPSLLQMNTYFANGMAGTTHGLELSTIWQPQSNLRMELNYSYINTDIAINSIVDLAQNSAAPEHQLSLRSLYNPSTDIDIDVSLRHVDAIEVIHSGLNASATQIIPAYLNRVQLETV